MTFPLFNADYKLLMIGQLRWHILKKCLIACKRPLCRVVSSFGFGYSSVSIIVYRRRRLHTYMALLWASIQHSKLHLHSPSSKLDVSVQRNISRRATHSTADISERYCSDTTLMGLLQIDHLRNNVLSSREIFKAATLFNANKVVSYAPLQMTLTLTLLLHLSFWMTPTKLGT